MTTFKTPKGTDLPILNLRGKDYLQVAHRLVWFREEKPSWGIQTELVQVTDKLCIARSVITDETGRVIATGHKTETPSGFPDFVEKAETGATGRALALCGYGTQFCADELDEGERLADSPVTPRGKVFPEQPTDQDGNLDETHYRIPFGKWSQRSIEEVYRNHGGQAMIEYIDYLEDSNAKKGQKPTPPVQDFIRRVGAFLDAMGG